jgi:hypothetical protein
VTTAFDKRLALVWFALTAISIASVWLGQLRGHDASAPNAAITFSVIAMALVKVRVIIREFMEVRHAPPLLCRLTDAWLVLTGVALLGIYFVGMAMRSSP